MDIFHNPFSQIIATRNYFIFSQMDSNNQVAHFQIRLLLIFIHR